mmetsp:Transcript_26439/g.71486  ORF Transcript_26439/g.71486 Transcript_26439/m.71486 type:complete len:86 (+) Transcript_26439:262-519(+)
MPSRGSGKGVSKQIKKATSFHCSVSGTQYTVLWNDICTKTKRRGILSALGRNTLDSKNIRRGSPMNGSLIDKSRTQGGENESAVT